MNEAIRGNFRLFFFFQKNFTHKKAYKMQKSIFYPDVYAQKALKSKQATFTHKWHKK